MKKLIITIALVLGVQVLFAQETINGYVYDDERNPVPFAYVYLNPVEDTSKIVDVSMTNLYGQFIFSETVDKDYILNVRMLGFNKYSDTINGVDYGKDFKIYLIPAQYELEGVEISGNKIVRKIDKTIINITKIDAKKSVAAIDLLNSIPTIKVNTLDATIKTINGGNVKILINGLYADPKELKVLEPEQVDRIEHYDVPPARYLDEDISSVINVVTKKSYRGGSAFISLQNAINTGYNEEVISVKYNTKHTQFSTFYNFSRRNYFDRRFDYLRSYSLDNKSYSKSVESSNNPFGYIMHNGNLKYVHHKENNYILMIYASPNNYTGFNESEYTINSNIEGSNQLYSGVKQTQYSQFSPHINIYFTKHLKNGGELTFDVVGTSMFNGDEYEVLETSMSNDTIMNNKVDNKISKNSIIAESLYSINKNNSNWVVGFKHSQNYYTNNSNSSFGESIFKSQQTEDYIYASLSRKIVSINSNLSLGLSYNTFQESNLSENYSILALRPRLVLSYPFKKYSFLRLNYKSEPEHPSLLQLSNNNVLIDNYYISTGNPELESYISHNLSFDYNFNKKGILLGSTLQLSYSSDPIMDTYYSSNDFMFSSYENERFIKQAALSSYARISPLKNRLMDLMFYASLFRFENGYKNMDSYLLWDYLIQTSVDLNYKKFGFRFSLTSDYKQLVGRYIIEQGLSSDIRIHYKARRWSANISIMNPLSKSLRTVRNTISGSLVSYSSNLNIPDNGQMIHFGLTYNFAFGKGSRNINKKISNEDKDTGINKY